MELPATSYWQGIGFDTTIADAEAATLFNGVHALRMGASLPGPVEAIYVRLSESIRDDTLLPAVSITGPDGPVTVQAIAEVKHQHFDGVTTWESVEGFCIRFAPQATEGEYTVRIAPTVADYATNRLDGSDEDRQGGEPEDAYEGSFRIVPVQVFGAVDLNSDVLTTPHSGGFGIALWEKVGARDPVAGFPQAGDQPDYVVSLTNDLTGNRYTDLSFAYAFTKDLSGEPILNQDPREGNAPRELYVTLLGQHATGAFIDPDTITMQDHSADPLWVALHPLPLANGRHQEWARIQIVGKSDVKKYPAGQNSGPLQIDLRADQLVTYPFRVLSWLSRGEQSCREQPLCRTTHAALSDDAGGRALRRILVRSHPQLDRRAQPLAE